MKLFIFCMMLFTVVSCQSGSKNPQPDKQMEQTAQVTEVTVNIGGMHCENCAASVEKGIKELEGVETVVVSLTDSTAKVSFDPAKVNQDKIGKAVEGRG